MQDENVLPVYYFTRNTQGYYLDLFLSVSVIINFKEDNRLNFSIGPYDTSPLCLEKLVLKYIFPVIARDTSSICNDFSGHVCVCA